MRPGDVLTVHAQVAAPADPPVTITEYEVVRDLPDPSVRRAGRVGAVERMADLTLGRSRARARVLRRGYDVAHIGNLVYQVDAFDLARVRRLAPLVCDVHDVRPHDHSLPTMVETRLLKRMYRNAGHLVVLHDVLKDEVVSDFGVPPDRVHVVPHVLDANVTPGAPAAERTTVRPTFLFFGTLRRNKGITVLADALGALGPALDADVIVAGAGDEETTTMLKQRLGPLPHVRLEFGRISAERKRELFGGASFVLLPYVEFHSQSGVLADAYAYRVPLIVTDVGAIGPTVRDDATGYVVQPGDADALADALLRAARNGRTFTAALDAAASRHDVSVVGPALRTIYELAARDR
jgi:glycosyltransferase involved in cell wall biosynthesis